MYICTGTGLHKVRYIQDLEGQRGFKDFTRLTDHVLTIPYGNPTNEEDLLPLSGQRKSVNSRDGSRRGTS